MVATGTPDGTTGTLTVARAGSTQFSFDSAPAQGYVVVSNPVTSDTTAPVIAFQQSPNGNYNWFTTGPATVTVAATDTDDGGVAILTCELGPWWR